ncbi:hypothetical protein A8924_3102 [Saccharopolyspora erythraea NRRL 2338]|nr:hypothetical protein N599_10480 [Saccharopolyspora erythraea D]PFG95740.1 hypothetical protein A8924_3102 [Saccharopolyspora erythraea NRRL 2338]
MTGRSPPAATSWQERTGSLVAFPELEVEGDHPGFAHGVGTKPKTLPCNGARLRVSHLLSAA